MKKIPYEDLLKHWQHKITCVMLDENGEMPLIADCRTRPEQVKSIALWCSYCNTKLLEVEKPEDPPEYVIQEGETRTVDFFYTNSDRTEHWNQCPTAEHTEDMEGPLTQDELDTEAFEMALEWSGVEGWWEFRGEGDDG